MGTPLAEKSEEVMNLAHNLLQSGTKQKMLSLLNGLTVSQYLGDIWLQQNPSVKPCARELNSFLYGDNQ